MIELSQISKEEAARYMGVRGEPEPVVREILDKYEPIVRKQLRPNFVYRETDVVFSEDCVIVSGIRLTGDSIREHLKNCKRAEIFAATVSGEADKLIRHTAVTDMAAALAVDCLCSAAVEQVCNSVEDIIFSKVKAPYRTWRFSPGYGDLPISVQKDFLLALNAQRRIGLTVTDSCLLLPSKSVTAIIGISDIPPEHKSNGCASCSMNKTCNFSRLRS
jgi:hypothetical protein